MKGMKTGALLLAVQLLLCGVLPAQVNPVRPKDRKELEEQAEAFFTVLRPVVADVAKGVVEVRVWRKRVAYGTVVAKGTVLTKWSEVENDTRSLSCRNGEANWLPAILVGVYPEADLAVLSVEGLEATPVQIPAGDPPVLGSFLAMARPDGEAGAMGVVSVLPRSLRDSDRAYLGVRMDLEYKGVGVKIDQVNEGTGAEKVGLKIGDIVIGVNAMKTDGNFELSTALQRLKPGQEVEVKYLRGDAEGVAKVVLGGRPPEGRIPRDRMDYMNRMGGHRYSDVREDFRDVIQTDMQLVPEDCGAPVIGLDGRFVGIAIARAGRIKSFVLPAGTLKQLLDRDPVQPDAKRVGRRPGREPARGQPRRGQREEALETMRRHMEDMRRLMEELEKSGR